MRKRITILGFFSEDSGLTCFFKTNYRILLTEGYEFNIINIASYRPARILSKFGNYYEVPFYFSELNSRSFLQKRRFFNKKLHHIYSECRLNSDTLHLYLGVLCDPILITDAHKVGFKRIIVEGYANLSHKLNLAEKQLQRIGGKMVELYATDYIAVNQSVANFFYSPKLQKSPRFKILKNGIAIRKQRYHEEQNIYYRKRYEIGEKDFVIGNVGRFTAIKNQFFLIKSFDLFQKIYPNTKLVLIGDGPRLEAMRQYVYQLHLEDKVIFTGFLENPDEVQNIFNIFAYPALLTDLSISLLHSVANGAFAVVSDVQAPEIQKLKSVTVLSLKDPQSWADEFHCLSQYKYDRSKQSYEATKELMSEGYGISSSTQQLRNLYGIINTEDEF